MTKEVTKINKDKDKQTYQKLSIQVSLNGLSFYVTDTIANSILLSERIGFDREQTPYELQKQLLKLLDDHKISHTTFSEVVVIHCNLLFSLVPKSLFDPAELANYLKFNTRLLVNDHLAYDEIKGYEIVNVYVPFTNINNYIFERYGEFEYQHNGTVLINALLNEQRIEKQPICYVYVSMGQMDITIISNKKLILFNSFTFVTKEDFIYYILFTLEQLNYDTETCLLKLFGSIEEGDALFELCYRYVNHVSLFEPSWNTPKLAGKGHEAIDFTLLTSL